MSALLVFALLALSPAQARPHPADTTATTAAGVDPALAADIRKLLKATGAGDLALQSMNAMIVQMKAVRPDIPPEFWASFQTEVDADELIELLVPVYARHFDRKEVQALTAFYTSAAGKRYVAETPALMTEATAVGQTWGKDIATRVLQKMVADAPPAVPTTP